MKSPEQSATAAEVGTTAMLGPVDLDTLCAELLKRYGPSVTIRTEWEAYGSAGQTVWLGERKVASITARPIYPVQMPRDIGRPQGPREYVLMPNLKMSGPEDSANQSSGSRENRNS